MVTYAALIGRKLILCIMERCFERELQEVRGGTSAVYAFDFSGCIEKAIKFIKEYKDEIIRGLKKGWNRF